MRYVVAIAICLAGMTMFSGCKNSSVEEGVYVGTYTITNLYRNFSWTANPTIELKNGGYTYKELSNGAYYTSGSGNYSINGNKIIFELISYPIPMEAIDVIEELLLKGEYSYKFNGEKLTFSKTVFPLSPEDEYRCEFKLKKIK